MSDLISRCELFNRLATIQAETANEMKGKIYEVIQSAPAIAREEGDLIVRIKLNKRGAPNYSTAEVIESRSDCPWK